MLKSKLEQLVSFGLKQSHKLWWKSSAILGCVAISDFIWARYINSIGERHAIESANWGFIVIVLSAFVTISYVSDRRLILPAAIGAWIGTYLAV